MKTFITIAMIMMTTNLFAQVEFKVNSKVESLKGKFNKVTIKKVGNKIIGIISVKSMEVSKEGKRDDLLEYFDAGSFPTTSFKAEVKNGAVTGEYILKGKVKKLKGIINGKQMKFKVPLTDLVTGFKAMFLGDGDHVELNVKMGK